MGIHSVGTPLVQLRRRLRAETASLDEEFSTLLRRLPIMDCNLITELIESGARVGWDVDRVMANVDGRLIPYYIGLLLSMADEHSETLVVDPDTRVVRWNDREDKEVYVTGSQWLPVYLAILTARVNRG